MEDHSQLIAIQEEDAIVYVSDNVQHTSTPASFVSRRAKAPAPLDLGTIPGRSKSTSLNKSTSLGRRRSILIRSQSNADNSDSSISSSSSSSTTVSPSTSLSSSHSSTHPSPSPSMSTPTRRRRSTANAHVERFSVHLPPECVPSSSTSTTSSCSSDSRPHTPTSEDPEHDAVQIETTSPGPISQNGYSNFYLSLPNGKWMLRYRTKDRTILGTEEVDMNMI
ncbi:hypothetical protein BC937DRAFT_95640 [Endogone sp. FLAS-F59071]|nr:hypothetical protein BC937DRAFT_95640 [Endogone sp. FLAS-F59071]|eukprot:RUS20231.1 hypothetical protein BC937DRAFT_95640 [Endogone sp. FLAS-F59071]